MQNPELRPFPSKQSKLRFLSGGNAAKYRKRPNRQIAKNRKQEGERRIMIKCFRLLSRSPLVFTTLLATTLFLLSADSTLAAETDLPVLATSYLGGAENDQGNAIAVQADGTVVIAGRFSALPAAGTTRVLLGAAADAQGAILRFIDNGTTLASITRLGDSVDDMVLAPADDGIIAIGPFGLVKLSADGSAVDWSQSGGDIARVDNSAIYSSGRRVDVAENGDIAILGNQSDGGNGFNGKIHLFDASGNPIETGSFVIPVEDIGGGTYSETWEDIAIDSSRKLVFVTGKAQRCSAYQSSFLLAHSYASADFGRERWQSFTLWCSGADAENLGADARGKRVVYQDDFLYFVGNADGGNNLFTRKAQDHTISQTANVQIDRWNNGAGFGSGALGYFAKMDPAVGTLVNGQFQFSSLGVNNARSFRINALAVSSTGDVCIGGSSEKDMPLRDSLTLNGAAIGTRVDNENALICVSGDFTARNRVASWTGTSGAASSALTAIATRGGRTAVLGETEGDIVTTNAADGQKAAGTDVFFSVWGTANYPDGDFNCSTGIDIGDAVGVLKALSGTGEAPGTCLGADGDFTGDGVWGIEDAIGLLQVVAGARPSP